MNISYPIERTAILIIDPYNDFLSEGGKLNGPASPIMESVGTLRHMREVVAAARAAEMQVIYVPHHRATPADLQSWAHPTPYQLAASEAQAFAVATWGGEWHPEFVPRPRDIIVREHWGSSGFANTDLDFQLKQHRLDHVVLIGMIANTCLESTGKFGVELGYHVTLVRDATAAFSSEAMRVAHEINGPTYAHAILQTTELLGLLPR